MPEAAKPFEIGIAMAGAISAGAYSAGVTDFLFQALEEWERLKKEKPDTVPDHSVCIRAISGASAGSITAALAGVAIAGGLRKVAQDPKVGGEQPYKCVMPALYRAWVELPDMASPQKRDDLLSTNDIEGGRPPNAILNAKVLQDLTATALRLPDDAQGPANGKDRLPYLAERLHLYLTLSNMRGVPYEVNFSAGNRTITGHYMMSHGDRAHYILDGIGVHGGENAFLREDTGKALPITSAPRGGTGSLPAEWEAYGLTALASAAFPVGLAARPIDTDVAAYDGRLWPNLAMKKVKPNFPGDWKPDRKFAFMSLDGGMIDNEPFEFVHQAIIPDGRDHNLKDADTVSGAVIMVDPFPEGPVFPNDAVAADGSLLKVVGSVFPMLKNQARFKPEELVNALDPTWYSRWLIAPRRSGEKFTIATGLLGGFGGFLDESFRAFDYQLGRRNCQKFLSEVLLVRADNPMVSNWNLSPQDLAKFERPDHGVQYRQIIPVAGEAAKEVVLPQKWPQIDENRVAEIETRIRQRANYVVPKLIGLKGHPVVRWLLNLAWMVTVRARVLDFVHWSIRSDLVRRDQLAGGPAQSVEECAVLAELCSPSYPCRTVQGIGAATGLAEDAVVKILGILQGRQAKLLWSGEVEGKACWALAERAPNWLKRHVGLLAPAVD